MSIISALYAGVSGMAAMGKSIQVIGNNIANINTVGFKGSRAEFADLLSQSVNTPAGKNQIGRGVRVEAVQGLFQQGSFESTPVVTDVAINGSGYFVVTSGTNTFYSRAGSFRIDANGNLTNSIGMNVQGYLYDASGQPTGNRGPIYLSGMTAAPNATGSGTPAGTGIIINANLDATSSAKTFNLTDPAGTSNFSSSVTVYDSLGNGHSTIVYFNKTADNSWSWHALVDGGETTGGTAGTPVECATGSLTFDSTGKMTASNTSSSVFNFKGGAAQSQSIGFDFSNTTQYKGASVVNSLTQDGYASGSLQAIDINMDGVITGVFTNGQTRPLAQFAIASFPAETELFRSGNSLFVESAGSGQPIIGTANTGTNGTIAASTLELSNVDLSEEFVKLITNQRGFQANTKIISAGDQMLQTVIDLIR